MKQQKLYLKINIIKYLGEKATQSHQLIRVDDIKEFWPIIYGKEAQNYFNSLNLMIESGQKVELNPFTTIMSAEVFDFLVSKLNKKIGSVNKLNTNELNIVQSSTHRVCIVIQKDKTINN